LKGILAIILAIPPLFALGQKDITPNYWDSTQTYIYSATYFDSTGNIISSEKISIKPTGKPTGKPWVFEPKQTLVKISIHFNELDSLKLAPYPLNQIQKPWKRSYMEGVIQDSNRIWMHPIRRNQYVLTEIAPFPEVRFPIHLEDSWENTLWIYKAFGSFEGTVESNYKIDSLENRVYGSDTLECWKISSLGIHDKLGKSRAVYYFNQTYGFTEMNYSFYNEESIKIKLQNLTKK